MASRTHGKAPPKAVAARKNGAMGGRPRGTLSAKRHHKAFAAIGIRTRSAFDLQRKRDDRDAVVLDGAHAQPVRQRVPHDRRKDKPGIGANGGKSGPIDGRHDTDTATEPSRANAC